MKVGDTAFQILVIPEVEGATSHSQRERDLPVSHLSPRRDGARFGEAWSGYFDEIT